ncbi:MAG TPA: NADH-quinone oxidoreductase subunit NuoE [Candidatus Kapabacteria bacterium]|nr:NADH-quinone oxidoreductase subunit NuoE [Candidatus Kapabacteria bacterium]
MEFSPEELKKIEEIKSHYPETKAALMPVLWLAQKKFGWLSNEVLEYVANLINLSESHVKGVASFYTMYFKKPMGKYHVQVCTNVSCMLNEGEMIFEHISKKFGIKNMERTPDGLFSLEEVECMGACGGAPMIAINEDFHENVNIAKVEEILNGLK